jgi:hypothetical protein
MEVFLGGALIIAWVIVLLSAMAKATARAALFFITKSVLRPHAQKLRFAG